MLRGGLDRPSAGEAHGEHAPLSDRPDEVGPGRADLAILVPGENVRRRAHEVTNRHAPAVGQDHERVANHALAQVREPRLGGGAGLRLAGELRQRHDRDLQLAGQGLETAADLRDLLDAIGVLRRRRGLHQLEVVDDDEVQADLRLEPPSLGPELHRADVRRVVDVDGRLRQRRHRLRDADEVHLVQEAGPQPLAVDPADRGEEPQDQLLLAHLQAEDADRPGRRVPDGGVFRDVQGEAGLADGRAGREDDEVRGLQPGGQRIEVREARSYAADLAAVRVQVVEAVECLVEELLQRDEPGGQAALGDGVQLGLGPVDGFLDLGRILVSDPGNPPCCRDQVSQDGLALHDPGVLRREDGRGGLLGQRGQVASTADRLELPGALQRLRDRHDVDRLAALPEVHHDAVDLPVCLAVEVARAKDVRDLDDGVAVDQQGAEDGLLGLQALRRKAVEGHGGSGWGSGVADMVARRVPRREGVVHESGGRVHRRPARRAESCGRTVDDADGARQSSRRMTPISLPWIRTSS